MPSNIYKINDILHSERILADIVQYNPLQYLLLSLQISYVKIGGCKGKLEKYPKVDQSATSARKLTKLLALSTFGCPQGCKSIYLNTIWKKNTFMNMTPIKNRC